MQTPAIGAKGKPEGEHDFGIRQSIRQSNRSSCLAGGVVAIGVTAYGWLHSRIPDEQLVEGVLRQAGTAAPCPGSKSVEIDEALAKATGHSPRCVSLGPYVVAQWPMDNSGTRVFEILEQDGRRLARAAWDFQGNPPRIDMDDGGREKLVPLYVADAKIR